MRCDVVGWWFILRGVGALAPGPHPPRAALGNPGPVQAPNNEVCGGSGTRPATGFMKRKGQKRHPPRKNATAHRVAAGRAALAACSTSLGGDSGGVGDTVAARQRGRRVAGRLSASDEHAVAIAQQAVGQQRELERGHCARSVLDGDPCARHNRFAYVGRRGNIEVARQDKSHSTALARADLGLRTTAPLEAPSEEWWRIAKRARLDPGWACGLGAHALSKAPSPTLAPTLPLLPPGRLSSSK